MKKIIFSAMGILAVSGMSTSAIAQNYNKGNTNSRIMDDAQRMEAEETNAAEIRTMPTEVDIEPQAGDAYNNNPYDDFTGIYGGGDVGYSFTEDVEGMNGSLFLGYGFEHDFKVLGAYAGLEIAHEWSGADGDAGGLSYEKDHAWVATFRPGVSVYDDMLGYGIIGYSNAEFETAAGDESLDGLVLGIGTQFNTQTAFKPRIEYTYTNYEDTDIAGTSFDPQENNIKLGAVFQF